MRGKLVSRSSFSINARITPAHAGKTVSKLTEVKLEEDHPRACGENSDCAFSQQSVSGSPPRMRGKLEGDADRLKRLGITPAHAGKTFLQVVTSVTTQDHPRACGENVFARSQRSPGKGSPPRMRGKLAYPVPAERRLGITPAHAGKTVFDRPLSPISGDHPRACGENGAIVVFHHIPAESPPRMRGKLYLERLITFTVRITPAHAGKTRGQSEGYDLDKDHPRVCGENNLNDSCCDCSRGSPPRVRGKQDERKMLGL